MHSKIDRIEISHFVLLTAVMRMVADSMRANASRFAILLRAMFPI